MAVALLLLVALRANAQQESAKWFEEFEKRFPSVAKNAAAEDLEKLSLTLGLDPQSADGEEHPTKEDRDAYTQAGASSWLDAQIKTPDDSISAPPPRFIEFLDKRQSTLWRVVGLLEREVPEWGFDLYKQTSQMQELLFVSLLNRMLLAAALVEERAGRPGQAADLLEACWSLYRSVGWRPEFVFQLIAVSSAKAQVGALRKMAEPRFEWTERMSGSEPRRLMLEAFRSDMPLAHNRGIASVDGLDSLWLRGYRAVAGGLQELSACEIDRLSSEEIWKPVTEEFRRWKESGGDPSLQVIIEMGMPNRTDALRRVSRLQVDRELTAKILELRQEKAAARPSRWPENFFDTESRVCPETTYEYQSRGAGMYISFKGSVADPGPAARVLPLSFEARAPRPTPAATPTRRAPMTRTPRPSLTPVRGGA